MSRKQVRNLFMFIVFVLAMIPFWVGVGLLFKNTPGMLLSSRDLGQLLLMLTGITTAGVLLFLWVLFQQPTAGRFRAVLLWGPALVLVAYVLSFWDYAGFTDALRKVLASLVFYYPFYLGFAWPFAYAGDLMYGQDRRASRARAFVGTLAALPIVLAIRANEWGAYSIGPDLYVAALPYMVGENLLLLFLINAGVDEGAALLGLKRRSWLVVGGGLLIGGAMLSLGG